MIQTEKVIVKKKLLLEALQFPMYRDNKMVVISCIYTETIFWYKTIKPSEQFGRQYKHLDALLDQ